VVEVTEMPALEVAPTNVEQAGAWDGDEGAFWAAHAEQFDGAVGAYHERFMVAAEIGRDDHVLDIGCGTGQSTRDAARTATDGSALGVDLSARMIDLARRLATDQRLANVTFEQADAQVHDFPLAGFDVAISRTGTMFFGDPGAAFSNIARSLRAGGRLVLLVWQGPEPNEWIRELTGALAAGRTLPAPPVGAPGPFAQADPDQVRSVLSSAGFVDIGFEGLAAPMRFGASTGVAFDLVIGLMGWMLQGLDAAGRDRALANLRDTISRHETDSGGVLFESATWLVTASRS
jgi:SAM-dependent methyltransferase